MIRTQGWIHGVAAALADQRVWMPPQASTHAADVDSIFYFIYWLCVLFFFLVIGTTILFALKYRRRGDAQKTSPTHGHRALEIVWSVVPAVLFVVMFGWGFKVWMDLNVPPADAMDVRVTGQKWSWSFDYPKDGINSADLVVPAGRPVKLTMSSNDVLHSFYVPDFRIKRDVLPNRYSVLWFEAPDPGEHQVFCTEYCGTNHSKMLAKVKVLSEADYAGWVEAQSSGTRITPEAGKELFAQKGCVACHSMEGMRLVGPALNGLYGRTEKITGGTTAAVDDNYLRESLLEPNAKVVEGFPPVMPTFQGQLKDAQIDALIEYIKSAQ